MLLVGLLEVLHSLLSSLIGHCTEVVLVGSVKESLVMVILEAVDYSSESSLGSTNGAAKRVYPMRYTYSTKLNSAMLYL